MRKAPLLMLTSLILIAACMLVPTPAVASPEAILEIPAIIPPELGQKFNVTINVIDVTDLFGFGITLVWNASVCEYTGTEGTPPDVIDKIWLEVFPAANVLAVMVENINNTEGMIVGYGAVLKTGKPTFNGTGPLITVEFRAKQLGLTGLNFSDVPTATGMKNSTKDLIPHSRIVAEIPVVPEFPAHLLMPLFSIATIIAVVLAKTVRSRRLRGRADVK